MKKTSSLIALAGALALLGGQVAADSKTPAKAPVSAEKKAKEGACGEGKCGAHSAKKSTKAGEGKCGAHGKKKPVKAGEGKCGEGKCGG